MVVRIVSRCCVTFLLMDHVHAWSRPKAMMPCIPDHEHKKSPPSDRRAEKPTESDLAGDRDNSFCPRQTTSTTTVAVANEQHVQLFVMVRVVGHQHFGH
ncbi:MAG: hypothetical protein KDD78_15095, partial [Caldilineaceae bacterium]|nr:hypothetical protein [Caldilineaceae bacterium]